MVNQRWFRYTAAYLFWAVALALALWLLVLLRNTVPFLITRLLVENPAHMRTFNIIFDRILVLGGGISWLVFMALIENYFRKSVDHKDFWRRIARVIGVLLLVIFAVDAGQTLLNEAALLAFPGWLLLAAELVLGAVLVFASRSRKASPTRQPESS